MNEERKPERIEATDDQRQAPSGNALPSELQSILRDLQSPDADTRARAVRALCPCRGVQWGVPIFRYVRQMRSDPNPIVRRAVRHDLKENPWWSERQEARPDVGPHPRTVKVTLAVKGMALGDLCDHLRVETGVPLVADPSVAVEKVTLFCRQMPLRDVIRQLSRALDYTWVWSSKKGVYRYVLMRNPHVPRPEEPRRRDRREALVAMEREMETSAAALHPDNARVNARFVHDRALRRRVTVQPVASDPWAVASEGTDRPLLTAPCSLPTDAKRFTSADVLEALHRATGMPIVADFSARLYPVEAVSARDQTLFAALNQVADAMGCRWHKEPDGWLQFRSAR